MQRKELKYSRRNVLNATLWKQVDHTNRDPIFMVFGEDKVAKQTDFHTLQLTKIAELLGKKIRFLSTWKILRNTLREQKWFLQVSRKHRKGWILSRTLSSQPLHRIDENLCDANTFQKYLVGIVTLGR